MTPTVFPIPVASPARAVPLLAREAADTPFAVDDETFRADVKVGDTPTPRLLVNSPLFPVRKPVVVKFPFTVSFPITLGSV